VSTGEGGTIEVNGISLHVVDHGRGTPLLFIHGWPDSPTCGAAPRTIRTDEMAWYQLFFQFEGVAEATIANNDWAWLRRFTRGDGDQERYFELDGGTQTSPTRDPPPIRNSKRDTDPHGRCPAPGGMSWHHSRSSTEIRKRWRYGTT